MSNTPSMKPAIKFLLLELVLVLFIAVVFSAGGFVWGTARAAELIGFTFGIGSCFMAVVVWMR